MISPPSCSKSGFTADREAEFERIVRRRKEQSLELKDVQIKRIMNSLSDRSTGKVSAGMWHNHLVNTIRMEMLRAEDKGREVQQRRRSWGKLGHLFSKLDQASKEKDVGSSLPPLFLDLEDSESQSADMKESRNSADDEHDDDAQMNQAATGARSPSSKSQGPTSDIDSYANSTMGRGKHKTLPAWQSRERALTREDDRLGSGHLSGTTEKETGKRKRNDSHYRDEGEFTARKRSGWLPPAESAGRNEGRMDFVGRSTQENWNNHRRDNDARGTGSLPSTGVVTEDESIPKKRSSKTLVPTMRNCGDSFNRNSGGAEPSLSGKRNGSFRVSSTEGGWGQNAKSPLAASSSLHLASGGGPSGWGTPRKSAPPQSGWGTKKCSAPQSGSSSGDDRRPAKLGWGTKKSSSQAVEVAAASLSSQVASSGDTVGGQEPVTAGWGSEKTTSHNSSGGGGSSGCGIPRKSTLPQPGGGCGAKKRSAPQPDSISGNDKCPANSDWGTKKSSSETAEVAAASFSSQAAPSGGTVGGQEPAVTAGWGSKKSTSHNSSGGGGSSGWGIPRKSPQQSGGGWGAKKRNAPQSGSISGNDKCPANSDGGTNKPSFPSSSQPSSSGGMVGGQHVTAGRGSKRTTSPSTGAGHSAVVASNSSAPNSDWGTKQTSSEAAEVAAASLSSQAASSGGTVGGQEPVTPPKKTTSHNSSGGGGSSGWGIPRKSPQQSGGGWGAKKRDAPQSGSISGNDKCPANSDGGTKKPSFPASSQPSSSGGMVGGQHVTAGWGSKRTTSPSTGAGHSAVVASNSIAPSEGSQGTSTITHAQPVGASGGGTTGITVASGSGSAKKTGNSPGWGSNGGIASTNSQASGSATKKTSHAGADSAAAASNDNSPSGWSEDVTNSTNTQRREVVDGSNSGWGAKTTSHSRVNAAAAASSENFPCVRSKDATNSTNAQPPTAVDSGTGWGTKTTSHSVANSASLSSAAAASNDNSGSKGATTSTNFQGAAASGNGTTRNTAASGWDAQKTCLSSVDPVAAAASNDNSPIGSSKGATKSTDPPPPAPGGGATENTAASGSVAKKTFLSSAGTASRPNSPSCGSKGATTSATSEPATGGGNAAGGHSVSSGCGSKTTSCSGADSTVAASNGNSPNGSSKGAATSTSTGLVSEYNDSTLTISISTTKNVTTSCAKKRNSSSTNAFSAGRPASEEDLSIMTVSTSATNNHSTSARNSDLGSSLSATARCSGSAKSTSNSDLDSKQGTTTSNHGCVNTVLENNRSTVTASTSSGWGSRHASTTNTSSKKASSGGCTKQTLQPPYSSLGISNLNITTAKNRERARLNMGVGKPGDKDHEALPATVAAAANSEVSNQKPVNDPSGSKEFDFLVENFAILKQKRYHLHVSFLEEALHSPCSSYDVKLRPAGRKAMSISFTPRIVTSSMFDSALRRLQRWESSCCLNWIVQVGATSRVGSTDPAASTATQLDVCLEDPSWTERGKLAMLKVQSDAWGCYHVTDVLPNQMRLMLMALPERPDESKRADTHLWPKGTFVQITWVETGETTVVRIDQRKQQSHNKEEWKG